MTKKTTVTINSVYNDYTITMEPNGIDFDNKYTKVWFPIEVFYQMWNSDELINFMEQYHKDREDVSTRVA